MFPWFPSRPSPVAKRLASPRPSRSARVRARLVGQVSLLAGAGFLLAFSSCVRSAEVTPRHLRGIVDAQSPGVVAVAAVLPSGQLSLCSGALVGKNLVLTARHCVSRSLTATPSCDARGNSRNGVHLEEDVDPQSISIYSGPTVRPGQDVPLARATRTLHPVGNVLCDADVAFLVLDHEIEGLPILPMRLTAPVEEGDIVVPIGFGGGFAQSVGTRVPRGRSAVLATGPRANVATGAVLGPREFEVDRATCRGDSGGPAIDARSGEIVGVVSRGGSCITSGNHVYTRIDAYARLADVAMMMADRELRLHVARAEPLPHRREP